MRGAPARAATGTQSPPPLPLSLCVSLCLSVSLPHPPPAYPNAARELAGGGLTLRSCSSHRPCAEGPRPPSVLFHSAHRVLPSGGITSHDSSCQVGFSMLCASPHAHAHAHAGPRYVGRSRVYTRGTKSIAFVIQQRIHQDGRFATDLPSGVLPGLRSSATMWNRPVKGQPAKRARW